MVDNKLAMGADPAQLQARIRKGTLMLFDVAQAIGHMPDSDTRLEMTAKFDQILAKLVELENKLGDVSHEMCWYGFAPKCPGCMCEDCEYLKKVAKLSHIVTVEEFDAKRIENAKKYYKENYEVPIQSYDVPGS